MPTRPLPDKFLVAFSLAGEQRELVRSVAEAVEKVLEPFVYEWISERKGSISAEHGLGVAKKNYIGYSRSDTMIGLMKQIKNLYDPVSPL